MKFSKEQLEQLRQLIRQEVGTEVRNALSNFPILSQEPKEAQIRGWIKKLLPKSVAGYACALFIAGGLIMAAVIYTDEVYQAAKDGMPIIEFAQVEVQRSSAYAQLRLNSPSFWSDPWAGKLPPVGPSPFVPVGIGITGGSNSVQHDVVVNIPAGTNSGIMVSNGTHYFRLDDHGNIV
jgi:hypothetical protein